MPVSTTLPSNDLDQYEGGLGVRTQFAAMALEAFWISPVIELGFGRIGGDVAFPLTVELLGTPIAAEAAELGRDVLRLGAQLNAVRDDGLVSGFLGYDGRIQEQASSHSLLAGLTLRF